MKYSHAIILQIPSIIINYVLRGIWEILKNIWTFLHYVNEISLRKINLVKEGKYQEEYRGFFFLEGGVLDQTHLCSALQCIRDYP